MSKILVLNGRSYASSVANLGEIIYDPLKFFHLGDEISLILFTGGADITPGYYNDASPKNMCYYDEKRDKMETKIFNFARKLNIRCIGICRGIQFLNVMANGRMWHHVSGHELGMHDMCTATDETFEVTTLHHQMIRPAKDTYIIGWSKYRKSNFYYGTNDEQEEKPDIEPEAALFPSIESAGVQYHPEIMGMHTKGWRWFNQLAKDLIETKDFSELINKYTRKPCIKYATV